MDEAAPAFGELGILLSLALKCIFSALYNFWRELPAGLGCQPRAFGTVYFCKHYSREYYFVNRMVKIKTGIIWLWPGLGRSKTAK